MNGIIFANFTIQISLKPIIYITLLFPISGMSDPYMLY
jgi:hypothetical protein